MRERCYKSDIHRRKGIFFSLAFVLALLGFSKNGKDVGQLKKIQEMQPSPGWCGSVVECQPVNQRATGSIPSSGHMPGLRAPSPVGGTQEATTH